MKNKKSTFSKIRSYFVLALLLYFFTAALISEMKHKDYLQPIIVATIIILIIFYTIFQKKGKKNGDDNPLTRKLGKTSLYLFLIIVIVVYLVASALLDPNFMLGLKTMFK